MTILGGAAAAWLATQREELNQRYVKAARRFPALTPDAVKARLGKVLPLIAGDEPSADALSSAVYDLVLLHEGRGSFASRPALVSLLEVGFARLRPHLLAEPHRLPGELSNAVEGLGEKGQAFLDGLLAVAPPLGQLHLAGAVIAWRLGESKLRAAVLPRLKDLDPRALLAALDLADWPTHAAPLAIRGLELDAWRHPRSWVKESTLQDKLQTTQALGRLGQLGGTSRVVARIGDFAGFGGPFLTPPLLHEGGDRHRFCVLDGEDFWSLEGDVFGWSARRDQEPPSDRQVRIPKGSSAVSRLVRRFAEKDGNHLEFDGTLRLGATSVPVPELARARSYLIGDRIVAACFEGSHRIRIAVPVGEPL